MKPKSELILYQTEDNRTRIEVRLENETVWLTQKLLAELFQKDVRTINEHIQNIFEEGELMPGATIRKFRITAVDGKTYDSVIKEFLTTAPTANEHPTSNAEEAKREAELEFDKFEVRRRQLEDAGAEAGFALEVANLTKAAKQIKPAKRKK
jgi:hypothetical protein